MLQTDPTQTTSLGADLRALRKARGLTLAQMAEALDRSVGWLSQVERGLSDPSVSDLREMATLLDVSVSSLFRQDATSVEEHGYIVRAGARRPIGSREEGLVEELLSPDLTDDFEVVHSTFAPGACITEPVTRQTQEVAYVISGTLDLWINGVTHILREGDSFRLRGDPYKWQNTSAEPAVLIWVISPPVY